MTNPTERRMRGYAPHGATPTKKDEIESVVAKAIEKPVKRKQRAE
ncbi:MAG: hypothetical protein ABSD49_07935 [Candidatus Bathyarchaeia archaeon]|jgi:hypothetical protein